MANEPSQYPNPVSSGGMGSPDYMSVGGGGQVGGYDVNSLREYLPQPTPRTNSIRNNSMQGAVVGTPGTLPTNWGQSNNSGIVAAVFGTGIDTGMDYIDILISGTTGAGTQNNIFFDTVNGIAGTLGQMWTASVFFKIIGNLVNIGGITLFLAGTNGAANTETFPITLDAPASTPFSSNWNRAAVTGVLANAGTTNVRSSITINAAALGVPVNLILRLGWPQLELGNGATTPLRTTGAAVTRSTNGGTRQPYLGSPPAVVSISGFGGAGAGAFILNNGSDADRSQGLVSINVGPAPSASGTIVLNFPAGVVANQYVVSGEWLASAVLGVSGSQLTITWTANRNFNVNEDLLLAYQWATST